MTTDRIPGELGNAGKALWSKIVNLVPAEFEFDERETELLRLACRQADDLARLENVIAQDGPMTVGSTGQPVLHPAVSEARLARAAIARLLGQLPLPDHEGKHRTAGDLQRQRAAGKRWSRERDPLRALVGGGGS